MLSLLLSTRCVSCRSGHEPLCSDCVAGLQGAEARALPGLDSCSSLLAYEGTGKRVIYGLKYGGASSSAAALASAMAALVDPARLDLVTWAPTTGARRRARGFDQAELLACAVARRLGLPTVRLLSRSGGGGLTGRSRLDRRARVGFRACGGAPLPGRRVLVVDDVVTSGATLTAAGGALRQGGAAEVHGLTLAATPSHSVPAGGAPGGDSC